MLMTKKKKKERNMFFWLMIFVGMIYGITFGYFVSRYINEGKTFLILLLFMIIGILIGLAFALSTKNGN